MDDYTVSNACSLLTTERRPMGDTENIKKDLNYNSTENHQIIQRQQYIKKQKGESKNNTKTAINLC